MTFTSLHFFIFFPVVCVLFYATPARFRWLLLLVASYYFYINLKPVFALLTAGITLSTWFFTNRIQSADDDAKRNKLLWANVVLILLPLLFFKYFPAINQGVFDVLTAMNVRYTLPEISLLMPVGISFYTFMAIGYTVDVYNEEIEAEKNLGILALFISFFPLVLSGPIERGKNMLPQFHSPAKLDPANLSQGLKWMLWGFFMKLVVADRIGIYIDEVFKDISIHNGTTFTLTTILYPFQVYADLGGYSLIAIGCAKIMGFDVMQNFRRPFFSISMAELWRRWHISLITWITDYIYTPISFSLRKRGKWGIVYALLLAFLISGIWHGARMTYVIWGLMQGIFLSIEALTAKNRKEFRERYNLSGKPFFIFVCCIFIFGLFAFSQIFGRADNLSDAATIIAKLFTDHGMPFLDMPTLTLAAFGLGLLFASDFRDEYFPTKLRFFENRFFAVRFTSYLFVLLLVIFLGVVNNRFIYFNF
ncbi:MAG: MBOAT family protein [Flavobacterium sp.]|uniref:MBOAT family O-acyltransferase n=1 Tax=Flavobacterium sp. TaxID=239 RepID=UPI0012140692|nr:MBOAT family O-acyltransferase [Flavobacterium sp.]RZJ65402.1 MAG: MBOAT family protein [Flavobacterium sp.]